MTFNNASCNNTFNIISTFFKILRTQLKVAAGCLFITVLPITVTTKLQLTKAV